MGNSSVEAIPFNIYVHSLIARVLTLKTLNTKTSQSYSKRRNMYQNALYQALLDDVTKLYIN